YSSLRQLLLEYLDAERQHAAAVLEDEQSISALAMPASVVQANAEGPQKLVFNGSMRELALFFQLLVQRKVVLPGKGGLVELSRFLSANISTKGSETLSAD